jgi:hypothetical protein
VNVSASSLDVDINSSVDPNQDEEGEEEVEDDHDDEEPEPESGDSLAGVADEQSEHEPEDNNNPATDDRGIAQLIHDILSQSDSNEIPAEDAIPVKQELVARTHIKRDSKGRLRIFTAEGEEVRRPDFDSQHRTAIEETQRGIDMDDLTPKSSMSPTQENPASAYDRFDIQQVIREGCPSTANTDNAEAHSPVSTAPHDSLSTKQQHASHWTESTANTYGENDTGHVKLDFEPDIMDEDQDQPQSQDAPFAVPRLGLHFAAPSYDPQTPAAPVNPFSQKGSVMKGSDLFGATQPSSVARFASPTSSRPSPADVYNDFTSPPKRQRINSSPLMRLYDQDPSPLQSSVRGLLATSVSVDIPDAALPRTSGVQSFDLARSNSPPAPRPYVSMKESQEKRKRGSMNSNSDTDASDSDGAITQERKRNRESRIKRELSTVALPSKRVPASSRPPSSESPAVEVPSTGRRRSVQEEYIAQCEGHDARDTQQDDYIADSQGASNRSNGPSQQGRASFRNSQISSAKLNLERESISDTPCRPRNAVEETIQNPPAASQIPEERVQVEQRSQPDDSEERDPSRSLPEPSFPLKEASGNRSGTRTPTGSKNHMLSDGPDTVPETSPPEQRIPPLGGIAERSFRESQLDIDDVPGFTQDVEFERAVDLSSPKRSCSRPRSFRQDAAPPLAIAAPVIAAPVPTDLVNHPAKPSNVPPIVPDPGRPNVTTSPQLPESYSKNEALTVKETTKPDLTAPVREIPVAQALEESPESEAETADDEGQNMASEVVENDVNANDASMPEAMPSTTNVDMGFQPEANEAGAKKPATKRAELRKKGPSNGFSASSSGSNSHSSDSQQKSRAHNVRAVSKTSAGSTPNHSPHPEPLTIASSVIRKQSTRAKSSKQSTPAPAPKRSLRRSMGVTPVDETTAPTSAIRVSKRQSTINATREASEDPLVVTPASMNKHGRLGKSVSGIFEKMAFAVSYVKNDQERNKVIKLITEYGGLLLGDGFDALFDVIPKTAGQDVELTLSEAASSLGFTALIADEHSRKNKFMQALALGLPCISGRWISQCVAKMIIVDWAPYLLCAGQSSFLGNALRSRVLAPYPASDAVFSNVFFSRERLLEGKSILLVTGKGKTEETRKAYVFLTRALGPARVGQAVDFLQARKRLVETEGTDEAYDLLYVEKDEKTADSVVFGSASTSRVSKKRKRATAEPVDADLPVPKKIRIIGDETMIQSLILGQLLEEE